MAELMLKDATTGAIRYYEFNPDKKQYLDAIEAVLSSENEPFELRERQLAYLCDLSLKNKIVPESRRKGTSFSDMFKTAYRNYRRSIGNRRNRRGFSGSGIRLPAGIPADRRRLSFS